jgi:uncharacterized protein (DUF1015 family)
MPELIPFRNFYYKVGLDKTEDKLKELTAPPYDVISESEKVDLKNLNPNNICHIILPESYEFAGKKLDEMTCNNMLVHGDERCICIYGIDYTKPDTGEAVSRYGFVGLLKLVETFPAKDGVIPHERTFKKLTTDRFNLIQHTDANFSPIWGIYNGNSVATDIFKKYTKQEPFLKTVDRDGFTHNIWEVWNEEDVKKFQDIVAKNNIIIADGHHRYSTCLRYSKHGGCKYIMTLFTDFNDPGLIMYTSHRQINKIFVNSIDELKNKVSDKFDVKEVKDVNAIKKIMEDHRGQHVFGCYFLNTFLFFRLRDNIVPEDIIMKDQSKEWKNLNLPILHYVLLADLDIQRSDISYVKGIKKGVENVDTQKDIKALFIVNPTTLEEVHKITKLGEIMPQKSTYFYPKPLSGLVIHVHTDTVE